MALVFPSNGHTGFIFNLNWIDRVWRLDRVCRRQSLVGLASSLDNNGADASRCRLVQSLCRNARRQRRILAIAQKSARRFVSLKIAAKFACNFVRPGSDISGRPLAQRSARGAIT
jgi:hypothetical protein